MFRDTFEIDSLADWEVISGTGELTRVTSASATGGCLLLLGNTSGNDEVWIAHKGLIPYDPAKLYEFSCRILRSAGVGTVYLGFMGIAGDGVTKVNIAGDNSHGSQHYIAASNLGLTTSFQELRGYMRGTGGTPGGPHTDPSAPATAHANVRYLRPYVLANLSGQTGRHWLDYVAVKEIDLATDTLALDGLAAATAKDYANRAGTALNTAGRLADSKRLRGTQAAGLGAGFSVAPISGWTDMTGSARINIQASTLYVGAGTASYPAGSVSGLAYSTTYHIYRDDLNLDGGGTYQASTSKITAWTGEDRVYFGAFTTGASGGSGGGTPPPGEQCVALDMWLAPGLQAGEAGPGENVWIMEDARRDRAYQSAIHDVHGHHLMACVNLVTASGGSLIVSADTPVTLEDGLSVPAHMMAGRRIAQVRDGVFGWTDCISARPVGPRLVARISVGGHCYFAGAEPHNLIGTHNAEKP